MASLSHILNPEPDQSSSTTTEYGSVTPVVQSATITAVPASMMPVSSQNLPYSNVTQVTTKFEPKEFARPMPGITSAQQQELQQEHARFALTTEGGGLIKDEGFYVTWKNDPILQKLGRTKLTVYHYRFSIPGKMGDPVHVMWDREIGMVRMGRIITAKDGMNKGHPKICIGKNPGLDSLAMNITGGATGARGGQGYWIPFDCARAMCATFAYDFRWALTPIFGYDFINECLAPTHESYDSHVIDRALTVAARAWLEGLFAAAAAQQDSSSAGAQAKKGKKKSPSSDSVAANRTRRHTSKQVTPAEDEEEAEKNPAKKHSRQLVGKKRPREGEDSEDPRPQASGHSDMEMLEAAQILLDIASGRRRNGQL